MKNIQTSPISAIDELMALIDGHRHQMARQIEALRAQSTTASTVSASNESTSTPLDRMAAQQLTVALAALEAMSRVGSLPATSFAAAPQPDVVDVEAHEVVTPSSVNVNTKE